MPSRQPRPLGFRTEGSLAQEVHAHLAGACAGPLLVRLSAQAAIGLATMALRVPLSG